MKTQELRAKSTGELHELEKELREKLFRLKMKHYTGQLEQISDLRETKRSIAKVLTLITEKAS